MALITVRALGVEDWALYRSVRLAALADSPTVFISTLSQEQAFTTDVWRSRLEQRNIVIAEDDGDARGLIGIIPQSSDLAEIVSVWVHPAARGRGVGDLLMHAVLTWAHEHDVPEVQLWAAEGNHPAERLYTRHGFHRTGTVKPIRGRADAQEFSMTRSLRGSDLADLQQSTGS